MRSSTPKLARISVHRPWARCLTASMRAACTTILGGKGGGLAEPGGATRATGGAGRRGGGDGDLEGLAVGQGIPAQPQFLQQRVSVCTGSTERGDGLNLPARRGPRPGPTRELVVFRPMKDEACRTRFAGGLAGRDVQDTMVADTRIGDFPTDLAAGAQANGLAQDHGGPAPSAFQLDADLFGHRLDLHRFLIQKTHVAPRPVLRSSGRSSRKPDSPWPGQHPARRVVVVQPVEGDQGHRAAFDGLRVGATATCRT